MNIDLHMHSTCSDGTDDVRTLIDNVKLSGIDFFSITDHDTAKSGRLIFTNEELKQKIKKNNLSFVCGTEWTCDLDGQRMHILSYDFNPFDERILALEKEERNLLNKRDEYRIKKLKEMGYALSENSLKYLLNKDNSRTYDFANCLINDGYFDNLEDAIKNGVKSFKVPFVTRLDARKTVSILKDCGAKVIWAHPIYDIARKVLSFEKVEDIVEKLKPFGLDGYECYYSLYSDNEIEQLKLLAKKHNLLISTGSDYHGKNKEVQLNTVSESGIRPLDDEIEMLKTLKNIIR